LKLLLATRNEHKRREFARLLAGEGGSSAGGDSGAEGGSSAAGDSGAEGRSGAGGGGGGIELDLLPEGVMLPPEDGETFAENAFGKARAAAAATGRVSIADDSGIAAAALDGAPGVRSARYAGELASDGQNLEKLMREAPAGSRLEYVCAIAYVDPARGEERLFEGRCGGRMATRPRGEGGFGYDPAFLPDDLGEDDERTMAELSDKEKDAISHRGRAARALRGWLEERQ
jgi:XTP/dITP diphosphohydrolase